jgi:secreted PhoX family phosphatase
MGRFYREACCTDPRTGTVYQSEDLPDGLLYRYLPMDRDDLHAGGRTQALAIRGSPGLDTGNTSGALVHPGRPLACEWIDLEDVESDGLRHRGRDAGAARFYRAEGMWWVADAAGGAAYFCCTEGGPSRRGQIFRYRPGPAEGMPAEIDHPGAVELFLQPDAGSILRNPDNIAAATWGDLIVCEDGGGQDELLGITPQGLPYLIGRNVRGTGELAGCCFSPDGTTLFVNMQEEGLTLAIEGDWRP